MSNSLLLNGRASPQEIKRPPFRTYESSTVAREVIIYAVPVRVLVDCVYGRFLCLNTIWYSLTAEALRFAFLSSSNFQEFYWLVIATRSNVFTAYFSHTRIFSNFSILNINEFYHNSVYRLVEVKSDMKDILRICPESYLQDFVRSSSTEMSAHQWMSSLIPQ
jgi:hypothetical protein